MSEYNNEKFKIIGVRNHYNGNHFNMADDDEPNNDFKDYPIETIKTLLIDFINTYELKNNKLTFKEYEELNKLIAISVKNNIELDSIEDNGYYMYYKGTVYSIQKDYNNAIVWFFTGHTKPNYLCTFAIANLYLDGQQVLFKNNDMAFKYLTKLVGVGFDIAAYQLGKMYQDGIGCQFNIDLAKKLFKQSVDCGNLNALYDLAYAHIKYSNYYMYSYYQEKDKDTAIKYFNMCLDNNIKKGMVYYKLAEIAQEEENEEETLKYLKKSMFNKNKEACIDIINYYIDRHEIFKALRYFDIENKIYERSLSQEQKHFYQVHIHAEFMRIISNEHSFVNHTTCILHELYKLNQQNGIIDNEFSKKINELNKLYEIKSFKDKKLVELDKIKYIDIADYFQESENLLEALMYYRKSEDVFVRSSKEIKDIINYKYKTIIKLAKKIDIKLDKVIKYTKTATQFLINKLGKDINSIIYTYYC